MEEVFRTAYVYVRNVFAGTLCETEDGYSFAYDKEYIIIKENKEQKTQKKQVLF